MQQYEATRVTSCSTYDSQVVTIRPIDPPMLCDNSFVVADYDCLPPSGVSSDYRQVRDYGVYSTSTRSSSICSTLVLVPPDDVQLATASHNTTLYARAMAAKACPKAPINSVVGRRLPCCQATSTQTRTMIPAATHHRPAPTVRCTTSTLWV